MLKRQRPASPPPTFFDTPSSPPLKRCRPTQPSSSADSKSHPPPPLVPSTSQTSTTPGPQDAPHGEYEASNSLLYEAHTLHHHRLLFASPLKPCGPHAYPRTSSSSNPPDDCGGGFNHPARKSSSWEPALDNDRVYHPSQADRPDDSQLVAERYSETNRLLGSLVLSRRRQVTGSESRE